MKRFNNEAQFVLLNYVHTAQVPYGAQNEGDGRGMEEKWWKRLEFSGLGELRGGGCAKRLVYIGLIWV